MRFARALMLALALLAAAGPGHAQRKFAVMSAVGDRLTVVFRVMSTGSNIDTNKREFMDIAGPGLDNAALLAAEDGIKAADKDAGILLLAPRTPLSDKAAAALREGRVSAWIAGEAKAQLAPLGVTHVVLISKHRGEARLNIPSGTTGSGRLEGLGFYVDSSFSAENEGGPGGTKGFLAAYAYIAVRAYDVQDGRQAGERIVMASTSTIPGTNVERAWEAMDASQKIAAIRQLVMTEVPSAITPSMLGAAGETRPQPR